MALRQHAGQLEFFLVHPGGPFFKNKDAGVWSIPKGLVDPEEDALACALREWREETGFEPPTAPYVDLGEVAQKGGKRVSAWAVVADVEAHSVKSNTFELEWPPRSGLRAVFPEVDRAAWCSRAVAEWRLIQAQRSLLERASASLHRLGLERERRD